MRDLVKDACCGKMDMGNDETIFAVSSGAGMAAVAVVRLSGPLAGEALRRLTGRSLPPPRRLALRTLRSPADEAVIDQALVAWLPGPRSFTGEDMAELHVHGSRAVIDLLLEALGRMKGLRAAERGEFVRRALLSGRMDLLEVEALADLLRAETRAQHGLAMAALEGEASRLVRSWRAQLVELLALHEAAIDFIDEEDVAGQALSGVDSRLQTLLQEMRGAIDTALPAERIREGVRVALAGPPNVGKSSLLNWLAGREVAIVSDMPGTTRDVLEVLLDLDGLPVVVFDTAGLREDTADGVEAIGVERARQVLHGADVVVWMQAPDVSAMEPPHIDSPVIWVWNKADVDSFAKRSGDWLTISVKEGTGLNALLDALRKAVKQQFGAAESALFARARQRQAITRAMEELEALRLRPDLPVELAAEHVRRAVRALDALIGRVDVEDLLDHIFAEFCIGK